MSAETRAEILDSAKKCVSEDRNGQYSEPEDRLKYIAEQARVYPRRR